MFRVSDNGPEIMNSMQQETESSNSNPGPGALYIFKGANIVRKNRSLWKYAAAPFIISLGLMCAGYFFLYHMFTLIAPEYFSGSAWYFQILYYLLIVVVAVATFVGFFFLFIIVATTIAAPFNDLLSEKIEQVEKGVILDQKFSVFQLIKDIGRGLGHTFKILGIYVASQVIGLLFLFTIPLFGQLLYTVITLGATAFILSMEFTSYSMDRRRMAFGEKKSFFFSNLRTMLSFGVVAAFIASIPIVNFLSIPAAVAGGTLLFMDLSPENYNNREKVQ